MNPLPPEALIILQRQLNTISVAQLRSTGVSRAHRDRLVAAKVLEHVGQSVMRVVGAPITLEARLVGLCLQHPQGYVTGPTAGGLLGLRRMPKVAPIHFAVPHGSRVDVPPFVRLRRTRQLRPEHYRQLDNGIVVASWARLAFDLSADLGPASLASVIEQMLHDGRCTEAELGAIARELCAPARPGSTLFARTLLRRQGRRPSESDPELQVLDGLLSRGVPVVPQVTPLVLPDGRTARVDMAVPAIRWGVEVDVHPSHLHLLGTTRDKQRDRQLHLIGWEIEHVTPLDLLDLASCLDELAELYRARSRAALLGASVPPRGCTETPN